MDRQARNQLEQIRERSQEGGHKLDSCIGLAKSLRARYKKNGGFWRRILVKPHEADTHNGLTKASKIIGGVAMLPV
jgi:hypothetical protein